MLENHLGTLVFRQAQKYGDRTVLKYKQEKGGEWLNISWNQLAENIKAIARSLAAYGVKIQDSVGIMSQNMHEVIEEDFANFAVRAKSVPMYATSSAEQIRYIVNDAEISIIFVGEQYQFDQAEEVIKDNKSLKTIVGIDPNIDFKGESRAMTFKDFLKLGENNAEAEAIVTERMNSLSLDDLAFLIYTSGTTGEPKGVISTHRNASAAIKNHEEVLTNLNDQMTSLDFLPLNHIFERGWTYVTLNAGMVVYINQDPRDILKTLSEVHPNCMCAVPRFWEKVYAGVWEKIENFPAPLKSLSLHALKIGEDYHIGHRMIGKKPGALLTMRYKFYEKTLFNIIRKVVGLDKGLFFPCAGAQCSENVNKFIHSIGINLTYGYGLTESFATVSCYNCYNENYDLQSVGDVMPQLDVKIGENNEILLKGDTITQGYYKKPKANEEAFTADGYFRTGDAGKIEKLPNGITRLFMTERLKELFKTSNGKYIAPQMVENRLEENKYIEQSCIFADMRKYVVALIVPAYPTLEKYAKENGIAFENKAELIKNEQIQKLYTEQIEISMDGLAAYEKVKYFTLLEEAFTPQNDMLTMTLKLKRRNINKIYADTIEQMYQH